MGAYPNENSLNIWLIELAWKSVDYTKGFGQIAVNYTILKLISLASSVSLSLSGYWSKPVKYL